MAGEYNLSVILSAQDRASNVVSGFLSNLGPIGGIAAGVGAALVGIGAASVSMAGSFQQSMLKSQAEAGLTQAQVTQMGNAILQMAPQVGQSPTQLANGLFFVESAGFAGKDALNALRLSAQMAANDMTDTTTVSKGLTTAIKAFGYQTSDSAFVANQMTVAVSSGKMTMADYANSIGKVALTAHGFGVSMAETNAGLDALTNNGFPGAARASTGLNSLLTQFDGNTDKVTKNIHALGLKFDENKFKSMNLGQQVQYLNATMKGHESQLKKVLGGNQNAAQAFQSLATGTKDYNTALDKLNAAQKDGGAETQSFASTQQGFNFKMQQAKASTDAMMIKLGQYLIPIIEQAGGAVADIVGKFANWVTQSNVVPNTLNAIGTAVQNTKNFINGAITAVQNIVTWYNNWKPLILSIAGAITAFFLPALIKTGVEAGVAGVKLAVDFVQSIIKAGVQSVIAGVKLTINFVKSVIQAGIEGWQSAGKLAIFIGQQIMSGTQAVIAGIKIKAQYVWSIIATGVESMIAKAKIIGGVVVGFVVSGVQSIIAQGKIIGGIVAAFIVTGVQSLIAKGQIIGGVVAGFIASGVQSGIAAARIVGSFVASMIATGTQAVISGAKVVASFIASLISAAAEAVVSAATIMASIVPALLATAAGALATAAPFILIGLIIAAVVIGIILVIQHWSQIMAGLKVVWAGISAGLQVGLKFLAGVWAGIWRGMQIVLQAIWNGIVTMLKIGGQILFDIIVGPIGLLIIYIIQHWTQIQKFIFNTWNTIKTDAMNAWSNLVNGINGHLSSFWNMINSFFGGLPAKMLNFGKEMIQWLINGIMGMVGAVGNAASTIASKIAGFLHFSKPDVGPLASIDTWMPDFGNLLASGLQAQAGKLQIAANLVAKPIASAVTGVASGAPNLTGAPNVSSTANNSGGNVFNVTINSSQRVTKDMANEIIQVLSQQLRSSGLMVNTPSGRRY